MSSAIRLNKVSQEPIRIVGVESGAIRINKVAVAQTNPTYNGDYSITPSSDIQILSTKNMVLNDDIVINPVPNNYGLITWNGSFLTIS